MTSSLFKMVMGQDVVNHPGDEVPIVTPLPETPSEPLMAATPTSEALSPSQQEQLSPLAQYYVDEAMTQ